MKTLIFIITILFAFTVNGFTQPKGFDVSRAIKVDTLEKWAVAMYRYEKLLEIEEEYYIISFRQTPAGLENAISKIVDILRLNELSISAPDISKDLFASHVYGISDYSSLYTSLENNSSTVLRVWDIDDWRIVLKLTNERYDILLLKVESINNLYIVQSNADVWQPYVENLYNTARIKKNIAYGLMAVNSFAYVIMHHRISFGDYETDDVKQSLSNLNYIFGAASGVSLFLYISGNRGQHKANQIIIQESFSLQMIGSSIGITYKF